MKFTISLLYCFLTTLALVSGQIYREYSGISIAFSDDYMLQYYGSTLSVSLADDLNIPSQNHTANSTILFALFLSNGLIIFATDTTIYLLDPVSLQLESQQPFLSNQVYLIPLWQDNRLTFATHPSSCLPLYYLDPTQNGQLFLIDNQYNVFQTYVSILGDGTIFVASPGNFQIYATNGTSLYSNRNFPMIDGVVSTDYGILAIASGPCLQIFNSTTYESTNLTFGNIIITYCTMPTPNRFLIFTQDYQMLIYDFSPDQFPGSFTNVGSVTLNSSVTMTLYIYINDGIFAIPCANSRILLYNVSSDSDFLYANISVPNMFGWNPVSIMYLQDTLFAVFSQNMITIFDYSTATLIKTISLATLGSSNIATGLLQYTDGSFFVSYLNNLLEPYYLITCHYSCASCSNLGPNACENCSSARILQSDSSCACKNTTNTTNSTANTSATCPADQHPCFVCGNNYELDLSSLSFNNYPATSGNTFPGPPYPGGGGGGCGGGGCVPPPTQNISTQGTGQDTTYISYIEAPNAGQNATSQIIDVYMQSETPIAYMLKVQGVNSQGRDSCEYIINTTSGPVTTSISGDPIYYSSMSISAYQYDSGPSYVIPFVGLRGTTEYTLKVCADIENVESFQIISFSTKNNNFKVVKYQISLNETISQDLTQDLLCYLKTLTNIPSSRIYANDGTQCNQIFFGMQATPEIYEKSGRKRVLDSSDVNSSISSTSSANSVIVLLYGNPNIEGIDMSVDFAVLTLNNVGNNGLVFKDRNGNSVTITSMVYLGLAGLGNPILIDNMDIETTPDTVTLSNIVVNGTSGYIYAMLSTDTNQSIPTQEQIRTAAIGGNNSDSEYNTSYFWYFNNDTPVSIDFEGLSKGQWCTVYYFASNEDLTDFAKYTDVHAKTVRTDNSINPAQLIMIIALSIAMFILCAIIIMCCAIKKRGFGRRGGSAYRHNNVIEIKKTAKIKNPLPTVEIKLQDLKQEKAGLKRILSDLEKAANNTSIINMSHVHEGSATDGKDNITPNDLLQFKQKIKDIENKIGSFEQEKLCPICLEHPKDLLLNCEHLICSIKCGAVLEVCPFDNTLIRTKKKIFQT